jgi:hypothetical protein
MIDIDYCVLQHAAVTTGNLFPNFGFGKFDFCVGNRQAMSWQ